MASSEKTNGDGQLLWVDLETTGLDPRATGAKVLEFGYVVTDYELVEITSRSWLVEHPFISELDYDEFIQNMHGPKGTDLLWISKYSDATEQIERVDRDMSEYLQQAFAKPPVLCGSSVQFDRSWMEVHMPHSFAQLHYRNIDLSSVMELARRWRPDLDESKLNPAGKHRALPDLRDTIELARFYKENLFNKENSQ